MLCSMLLFVLLFYLCFMIDKFIFDIQLTGDAIMHSVNLIALILDNKKSIDVNCITFDWKYQNQDKIESFINQPYFNN